MPARTHRRLPSYRLHKPSGLAVVRLDGRDHYLGKHGTAESRGKYRRTIAEWLSRHGTPPTPRTGPAGAGPTVGEVIKEFLVRHAATHYRRADGTPTGELANFRMSLRPLRRLYSGTPARDFSPKALKAVRQSMVDAGLARGTINQRVGRIIHVFKWAVSEEMLPPDVHHGLKAVGGLKKGRTAARETEPVKPVPEALVDAVRPHVARQVWAMIELQRLTGMRPGEVILMRTCDLDTSGRVWVYTPVSHKTAHHGHERRVYLGPRAQAVLRPWFRTDLSAYLFSPREAMAEYRAAQRRDRKTPLYPSQRDRPRRRIPSRSSATTTRPAPTTTRSGTGAGTRGSTPGARTSCGTTRRPGSARSSGWTPHGRSWGTPTRARRRFTPSATPGSLWPRWNGLANA
jgi:integrase